jgi:hypothetical protein
MFNTIKMPTPELRVRLLRSFRATYREGDKEPEPAYCDFSQLAQCIGMEKAEALIVDGLVETRELAPRKYRRKATLERRGVAGVMAAEAIEALEKAIKDSGDSMAVQAMSIDMPIKPIQLPTDPWNALPPETTRPSASKVSLDIPSSSKKDERPKPSNLPEKK